MLYIKERLVRLEIEVELQGMEIHSLILIKEERKWTLTIWRRDCTGIGGRGSTRCS